MPEAVYREAAAISELCPSEGHGDYLAVRMLLDTSGYLQRAIGGARATSLDAPLQEARSRLQAAGIAIPGIEAQARYRWIGEITSRTVERPRSDRASGATWRTAG